MPEEIGVMDIFSGIKSVFRFIGLMFYYFIKFLLKNKYWLISLIIIGAVLGVLLDKYMPKKYKSEAYVVTNLESSNYLYTFVDNFDNDKYKSLKTPIISIKIEPVKDVFSLVEDSRFDLFKILLEDGKNTDFIKDETLDKNYKYHKIIFTTKNNVDIKGSLDYFLKDINESPYLNERIEKEKASLLLQRKESFVTIDKINELFVSFGETNQNQLNVQTFTNLGDVLNMKNAQIEKIKKLDSKLIEYEKPVYIVNGIYGVENHKKLYSNLFLIFPILFVFIFMGCKWGMYIYNSYSKLEKEKSI